MENWLDVSCFEGLYQVSDCGNVRSIPRTKTSKNGGIQEVKGGLLTTQKDRCGYYRVCLTKKGKSVYKRVNRLVAEAFIPNPDNLPQVNHKNEDKTDNRVENLEWCDAKYNSNYGSRNKKVQEAQSVWVIKLSLNNEILHFYRSAMEAERETGIPNSNINKCCKGIRKSAGGYIWKYSA